MRGWWMMGLVVLAMVGCGGAVEESHYPTGERLRVADARHISFGLSCYVLADSHSGRQFLVVKSGHGVSVVLIPEPLLDR